ncbi:MAG: hypothetical protein ACREP8_15110, partial [Candidatus Binatia bacterium]
MGGFAPKPISRKKSPHPLGEIAGTPLHGVRPFSKSLIPKIGEATRGRFTADQQGLKNFLAIGRQEGKPPHFIGANGLLLEPPRDAPAPAKPVEPGMWTGLVKFFKESLQWFVGTAAGGFGGPMMIFSFILLAGKGKETALRREIQTALETDSQLRLRLNGDYEFLNRMGPEPIQAMHRLLKISTNSKENLLIQLLKDPQHGARHFEFLFGMDAAAAQGLLQLSHRGNPAEIQSLLRRFFRTEWLFEPTQDGGG